VTQYSSIGLLGLGQMGSAVGSTFLRHGLKVVTIEDGRSVLSVERATSTGISFVGFHGLIETDLILSIVPPGNALDAAREVASNARTSGKAFTYLDCNAVCPSRKKEIGALIEEAGGRFQDVAIIGRPPSPHNKAGPVFYTSGRYNELVLGLSEYGIRVKALDNKIGSASVLKMSYAAINKGLIALTSAIALQLRRMPEGSRYISELSGLLPLFESRVAEISTNMYPKANRWVAEMHEIASFLNEDEASAAIFDALASFYQIRANEYDRLP